MIRGMVASRRAVVPLEIKGAGGVQTGIEAIVDTGFTEFLTLPSALIQELGLVRRDTLPIILADGTQRWADEFTALVNWHGAWQRIPVQGSEGDILIGMALMEDCLITIDATEGGEVSVAGESD